MEGKSIEPQGPIMRVCRYAETGTLSCGRAERPTELASQVHPPLGMVLLGEQAVRGIGIVRQPVQQKHFFFFFFRGARVLTGCGIARHPGLKNNRITHGIWHRARSFAELASR